MLKRIAKGQVGEGSPAHNKRMDWSRFA